MKIRVLEHSSINTLGTIEEYATIKNHVVESTRFYEIKRPPPIDSFDLLITMAGPMGIYDYNENPWLRNEKDFIKQAVEAGKPVLGICLGAQMLADILGARVYNNRYMEMGWFPVKTTAQEKEIDLLKGLPDEITVFHWHSQTFDLPAGALHLFESDACKNQGFIYGDRVVALQFHPEVNEERIQSLINLFGDGIVDELFVQKKEEMLGQGKYLAGTREFVVMVLDKFEKIV
jgi:GMP synthase-like glutamine amidotransferase